MKDNPPNRLGRLGQPIWVDPGAQVAPQRNEDAVRVSPLAGKPAEPAMLVDVPRLVTAYFAEVPDPSEPAQRVAFGTSGHRGSAFEKAFNECHILAISQAICLYRKLRKIAGPHIGGHHRRTGNAGRHGDINGVDRQDNGTVSMVLALETDGVREVISTLQVR